MYRKYMWPCLLTPQAPNCPTETNFRPPGTWRHPLPFGFRQVMPIRHQIWWYLLTPHTRPNGPESIWVSFSRTCSHLEPTLLRIEPVKKLRWMSITIIKIILLLLLIIIILIIVVIIIIIITIIIFKANLVMSRLFNLFSYRHGKLVWIRKH